MRFRLYIYAYNVVWYNRTQKSCSARTSSLPFSSFSFHRIVCFVFCFGGHFNLHFSFRIALCFLWWSLFSSHYCCCYRLQVDSWFANKWNKKISSSFVFLMKRNLTRFLYLEFIQQIGLIEIRILAQWRFIGLAQKTLFHHQFIRGDPSEIYLFNFWQFVLVFSMHKSIIGLLSSFFLSSCVCIDEVL